MPGRMRYGLAIGELTGACFSILRVAWSIPMKKKRGITVGYTPLVDKTEV